MITLASDCLVFHLASGEKIPFSSDMVSVELMGNAAQRFDPDFVMDAAKAVFHYFKHEQGRQTVTVGEFAEALEQVLNGFYPPEEHAQPSRRMTLETDLTLLARQSGGVCELVFFSLLRDELKEQVRRNAGSVRFSGLRSCVKTLLGARRWGERCRDLEEQIIVYLRECLVTDHRSRPCSLTVR